MNPVTDNDESARLILFVTGDAPRSQRARANLAAALEQIGDGSIATAEIDLLEHPEQTIEYGVFATPALLRRGDGSTSATIYGDLSDETKLRQFLSGLGS